jgi:hypothetical protein
MLRAKQQQQKSAETFFQIAPHKEKKKKILSYVKGHKTVSRHPVPFCHNRHAYTLIRVEHITTPKKKI